MTRSETLETRILALAALAIVANGILARCWAITAEPLWLDEAYSAYAAGKGFAFLWQVVPRYETHPPFYYTLLRLWTLPFGDSLLALRALGLACGIAAIGGVAVATREAARFLGLGDRPRLIAVALASAFFAASPLMVELTREVRPYPVMMLVTSLQIALLFRLGIRARRELPLWSRAYAGYLALLALTLWLHNMGVLHAAAQGLALLVLTARRGWGRADWTALVAGHVAVALVWAPAVWILVDQAPAWVKATWLKFSWGLVRWGLGALWAAPLVPATVAAGLLFLLGLPALAQAGPRGRALAALVVLATIPVAASVLVSLVISPVFIPRTMTPVALPAMMLLGLCAALAPPRVRILALGAAAMLLTQMAVYDVRARNGGARYDYYGAVEWLAARFQPGDSIYAYPNEGALPFRYALRDRGLSLPMRAIPTGVPTLEGGPGSWYRSGSRGVVSLNKARLAAIAAEPETRAIPTVWLYRLGPWAYDEGDHFVHALEKERVAVDRFRSGPIDIIGLRLKPESAAPASPPGGR